MKTAAIYSRVSTDNQEREGTSLQTNNYGAEHPKRRPCGYAREARAEYNSGKLNPQELVEKVWDAAKGRAKTSNVVEESTRGFLALTQKQGKNTLVDWHFSHKHNRSDGLWPWLNTGADIIEEGESPHTYRVRSIFYDGLYKVVMGMNVPPATQTSKK